MTEPLKEVIDELVSNLRKAGCEADRREAGSDLAVLLYQAERMITTLAATRTPGPATAAMIEHIRRWLAMWDADGKDETPGTARDRAFLAEHT